MLFNSLHFLLFFPIVVGLYFSLASRFRWVLLLAASYYFYAAWKPEYLLLIIASTLVDYIAAMRMDLASTRARKRFYLVLSLISNLGLLFAFKYFNFFSGELDSLFNLLRLDYQVGALDILLPVGISFYTFQTLSYTIDVYRGDRHAERHLGYFAVYVSFFPQLVAGPIERSTSLLPQFFEKHVPDPTRMANGLKLMAWGFFKKLVIADRLAIYVNEVYNNPESYHGLPLILATVFFAYQIYCDFSGYSDIAIGAAEVMGYRLMKNFKRPYFAQSIREFWQRWHVSLSTWFRDYLYITLGGNRCSKTRWYVNLMITFTVSGLWHGANWTFIIWGFLHGLYLIVSILSDKLRQRMITITGLSTRPVLLRFWRMSVCFVLVNISWVFFRANSLADAILIFERMFDFGEGLGVNVALGRFELVASIGLIVLLELIQALQETTGSVRAWLSKRPVWIRWPLYYAMIILICLFGVFENEAFIYFQF